MSFINKNTPVRAYPLQNGDVVEINGILLEFEDNILHEVIRITDTLFNPQFKRTGKIFTPEQINEMVNRRIGD